MIAEMTIWLEQNACLSDWEGCKEQVKKYFKPMHEMCMEKYKYLYYELIFRQISQVHDPH